MINASFLLDNEKNRYILKIDGKVIVLTRQECIEIHKKMTKVLKNTPIFNLGNSNDK